MFSTKYRNIAFHVRQGLKYMLKEIGLQDEKLYWFLFVEREQIKREGDIHPAFPNIPRIFIYSYDRILFNQLIKENCYRMENCIGLLKRNE